MHLCYIFSIWYIFDISMHEVAHNIHQVFLNLKCYVKQNADYVFRACLNHAV